MVQSRRRASRSANSRRRCPPWTRPLARVAAASTHDRRHAHAQAGVPDPGRLHPRRSQVDRLSQALAKAAFRPLLFLCARSLVRRSTHRSYRSSNRPKAMLANSGEMMPPCGVPFARRGGHRQIDPRPPVRRRSSSRWAAWTRRASTRLGMVAATHADGVGARRQSAERDGERRVGQRGRRPRDGAQAASRCCAGASCIPDHSTSFCPPTSSPGDTLVGPRQTQFGYRLTGAGRFGLVDYEKVFCPDLCSGWTSRLKRHLAPCVTF